MDDDIIGEFLVECYEGLDRLEQGLVVLEDAPDDVPTLTEVFRILHTIKGTCGFLDFGQLETVAHRGESLLSLLRDEVLRIDQPITDALLATNDAIRDILAAIEATGAEGDHDTADLIATLEALAARADEPEPPGAEPDDDAPAPAPAPPPPRIGDVLVEQGVADRTDVEIAIAQQSLGDDRKLGDILVEDGRADRAEVEQVLARAQSARHESVRVDVEVLDGLMNLVGELVLARNQIVQLAGSDREGAFAAPAQRLNLLTSELQEGVMKTRMQPIAAVWNKLPRLVRDLSHQFGKQIRIEMEGKDTELDRTLLEAIKDPLTHMIRNTVDHGIESPEVRIAAGKDPEGTLRLSASHEGGQVNVEISDDGAGIDADRIRELAVRKGVVTDEQADALTDQAAIRLVFRPGFSTAHEVSNVSGRGVGMDVVRTNIERIGGTVDIATTVGVGTSFKLRIPLTLAIIPAIIIRCDGHRYAIPQRNIQELLRLDGDQRVEDVHGAPVYRLRGRLLPIIDLRDQLGLVPSDLGDGVNVVVLNTAGRSFGVVVDAIDDTEEIVIKPLGRTVRDNVFFSGATVMGDGSVALILDVLGLAVASRIMEATDDVAADERAGDDVAVDRREERVVLVVGLSGGQRVALPIDQVDRLEEFDATAIEASNHADVVQYRDGVMRLLDLGPALGRAGPVIGTSDRIHTVVCSVGGESVGVVVAGVVDIADDPEIRLGPDGVETAIVDGGLVDIVDVASEVAARVPGLDAGTARTEDYVDLGAST